MLRQIQQIRQHWSTELPHLHMHDLDERIVRRKSFPQLHNKIQCQGGMYSNKKYFKFWRQTSHIFEKREIEKEIEEADNFKKHFRNQQWATWKGKDNAHHNLHHKCLGIFVDLSQNNNVCKISGKLGSFEWKTGWEKRKEKLSKGTLSRVDSED